MIKRFFIRPQMTYEFEAKNETRDMELLYSSELCAVWCDPAISHSSVKLPYDVCNPTLRAMEMEDLANLLGTGMNKKYLPKLFELLDAKKEHVDMLLYRITCAEDYDVENICGLFLNDRRYKEVHIDPFNCVEHHDIDFLFNVAAHETVHRVAFEHQPRPMGLYLTEGVASAVAAQVANMDGGQVRGFMHLELHNKLAAAALWGYMLLLYAQAQIAEVQPGRDTLLYKTLIENAAMANTKERTADVVASAMYTVTGERIFQNGADLLEAFERACKLRKGSGKDGFGMFQAELDAMMELPSVK